MDPSSDADAEWQRLREDIAYAAADAWGPDRTPRNERIRRAVPDATDNEVRAWLEEFRALESEIWHLAEAGGPLILGQVRVRQRLREIFPFLVAKGLAHAESPVAYYAFHEGWDQSPRVRLE